MGYREDFFDSNKSSSGWYTCARCGKKLRKADVDVDHIIPQSKGGSNNIYNLQCMCKTCNRSKGNDMDNTVSDYARNVLTNVSKDILSNGINDSVSDYAGNVLKSVSKDVLNKDVLKSLGGLFGKK